MLDSGTKLIKYLLLTFNLIFVFAGLALIAGGAYVKIKLHQYYDFFGNEYIDPGILLIVVGVINFLVAFFGCCGAYTENYCLTMTFAVTLGFTFVLEISGGIAGFVLSKNVESKVEDVLSDALKNYGKPGHDGVMNAWDKLQEELHCCGVNNLSDWKVVLPIPPQSCCKDDVSETECATRSFVNTSPIFTHPCSHAFENYLKSKLAVITAAVISLACVQIVWIIFACSFARAIRKDYEYV